MYYKKVDITNFSDVNETVIEFNPEYIVHLASRTDLNGKSNNDYSTNKVGVINILDVSKKHSKSKENNYNFYDACL
jgi:dTDP-4-dehydrorhamnose reductase